MHMGIIRLSEIRDVIDESLPHAHGDYPVPLVSSAIEITVFPMHMGIIQIALSTVSLYVWSSPCTWGLSATVQRQQSERPVFPMHMGIIRLICGSHKPRCSLPHAHGDYPYNLPCSCPSPPVFPMHMGIIRATDRTR